MFGGEFGEEVLRQGGDVGAALAQGQEPTSLGEFGAWAAYAYRAQGGKVCYVVSQPKSSTPKAAKRDPAFLLVTHRPGQSVRNEVSTIIGYPFKKDAIVELTVDPDHTREGHGSRLVQASAETLKADRFTHSVIWLASTDDTRRAFLTGAGWDADGAHRELDLHGDGSVRVKQIRLHTDLGDV